MIATQKLTVIILYIWLFNFWEIWTKNDFKIPWLFPDFWQYSNFPDHFIEFPDFSLTLKKIQISLTSRHPAQL